MKLLLSLCLIGSLLSFTSKGYATVSMGASCEVNAEIVDVKKEAGKPSSVAHQTVVKFRILETKALKRHFDSQGCNFIKPKDVFEATISNPKNRFIIGQTIKAGTEFLVGISPYGTKEFIFWDPIEWEDSKGEPAIDPYLTFQSDLPINIETINDNE